MPSIHLEHNCIIRIHLGILIFIIAHLQNLISEISSPAKCKNMTGTVH